MSGDLKPCGTLAAYRRHTRRREKPCRSCSDASNAYRRSQRGIRDIIAIGGRTITGALLNRIDDYLFIHGDQMTARAAAERLGVSKRTIARYRDTLRILNGSTT